MGSGDADESDPNDCISFSLKSYRIAATTRWSFFRMLQGVSWSDFLHNFLQSWLAWAMPSQWLSVQSTDTLFFLDLYLKNLKFPRRWTFRFLFNQRVSVFLFLANLLLWHVNCARSYGMRVAFWFWEYSYNITMCGHLIICQFCADLRNIQSVSSRFLSSYVLLLCVDLNYRYCYLIFFPFLCLNSFTSSPVFSFQLLPANAFWPRVIFLFFPYYPNYKLSFCLYQNMLLCPQVPKYLAANVFCPVVPEVPER